MACFALILLVGAFLATEYVSCQKKCPVLLASSRLYPYGPCDGDDRLHSTDDESIWINLKKNIMYFAKNHSKIFVNNNGALSFTEDIFMGNPREFIGTTTIMAVFWSDIDTRHAGGRVFIGQQTSGPRLKRAADDVKDALPGIVFTPRIAVVVTWENVTFFGGSKVGRDKRNTFQAVIVADEKLTFALFNYEKLEWTSGTTSGGDQDTGLEGKGAIVGYDVGDKSHFYTVPGSGKKDILKVASTSNIGGPTAGYQGKWFFNVNPDCIPLPPPVGGYQTGTGGKKVLECLQKRTCCVAKGNTYIAEKKCKGYVQYVGYTVPGTGPAYRFPCPAGTFFNTMPATCNCDWPNRVLCTAL